MILFNKKWNEEVLSKALIDIVEPSINTNINCCACVDLPFHTNTFTMMNGICTQSTQQFVGLPYLNGPSPMMQIFEELRLRMENFSIVTEKYLKTLDKFYKKLYHEDFITDVFYSQHILSIFQGIAKPNIFISNNYPRAFIRNHTDPQIKKDYLASAFTSFPFISIENNPNDFKIVIDRMISLGLMDEEDRLDIKDQCFLTGLKRANIQIVNNTEEKTIDIVCNNISDVIPDIKTENLSYKEGVDQTGIGMSVEHAFHKDKRLFLMWTPYLKNETTVKYGNTLTNFTPEEPTTLQVQILNQSGYYVYGTTSHEPISYFKPKTYQTRFNKGSMPMATHLIWRIGTQDTREIAITENSPFVPEVIFDHVDRISHIDNFKLRIKYNVVRF